MDFARLTAPRNLSIPEVLHARVCYSGFHSDLRAGNALKQFDGALIAVSHDQTFLQTIGIEREIVL